MSTRSNIVVFQIQQILVTSWLIYTNRIVIFKHRIVISAYLIEIIVVFIILAEIISTFLVFYIIRSQFIASPYLWIEIRSPVIRIINQVHSFLDKSYWSNYFIWPSYSVEILFYIPASIVYVLWNSRHKILQDPLY